MPSWFHFRPWIAPEDPSVAAVEQILGAANSREAEAASAGDRQPVVSYALWICACESLGDAPTWLIYYEPDGGFAWLRVPDRVEPTDLVAARRWAGGHTDPTEVLSWLRGDATKPWGSYGPGGTTKVLEALRNRINTP